MQLLSCHCLISVVVWCNIRNLVKTFELKLDDLYTRMPKAMLDISKKNYPTKNQL